MRRDGQNGRLALAAAIAVCALTTEASACDALSASWEALQAQDTNALLDLEAGAENDPTCRAQHRDQIGRWVALGLRAKAMAEADSLADARPDLLEALDHGRPWQVTATLGDAAREDKDFAAAAVYYQEALSDLLVLSHPSSPYWDQPPDPRIARMIKQRTDEMRLSADTFVSASGRPACQVQSMGMWAAEIVAPIRFETDSDAFTDMGRDAAEELFECLATLNPDEVREIRILGHTDPRGSDAYNKALSERRAEAVRAYLIRRGLKLPYTIEGRGESDRFQADDPDFYSQEELYQMDRRVEVDVVRHDQD